MEISRKSLDFKEQSRFQEKAKISKKNSRDFNKKLRFQMIRTITLCERLFMIRVREAFRVTPAVTKVDSLLRDTSYEISFRQTGNVAKHVFNKRKPTKSVPFNMCLDLPRFV